MADEIPLISEEEINRLEACQSDIEWNDTCDSIKERRDGAYPPDWWPKVMKSGLADRVTARWDGDTKLTIIGIGKNGITKKEVSTH